MRYLGLHLSQLVVHAILGLKIYILYYLMTLLRMKEAGGIYIYSERQELTLEIEQTLKERMVLYYVDVLGHGLRSIDFPDAFEQAQLEKRVAQEKIETAEFECQQSIINAQQRVIEAEAAANVTLIQAQAEAGAAFAV